MAQAEARAAAREAARAGLECVDCLGALALEVKRSPQEEATLNGFMRKTEKTLELMTAQIHALQKMVQILFLDSNRLKEELKGLKERETETETGQGGSSSSSSGV